MKFENRFILKVSSLFVWLSRVNRILMNVASLLILFILILTLWEVISRYGFRNPSTWILPVSGYSLLYLVFLGTAHTLEHEGHIRVEFVLEMLSPRWRRVLNLLSECLGLVFVLILGYLTFRLFESSYVGGEYDDSTLHLPLVFINVIMPFGMLLMALTYVGRIFRYFISHKPDFKSEL